MVSLWIIGALGYIPGFKPIANALLFLVVLVLFLSNSKNSGTGGIFAQFNAALTSGAGSQQNLTAPPSNPSTVGALEPLPQLPVMQAMSLPTLTNPFGGGGSSTVGVGGLGYLPGGEINVPGLNGVGTIIG